MTDNHFKSKMLKDLPQINTSYSNESHSGSENFHRPFGSKMLEKAKKNKTELLWCQSPLCCFCWYLLVVFKIAQDHHNQSSKYKVKWFGPPILFLNQKNLDQWKFDPKNKGPKKSRLKRYWIKQNVGKTNFAQKKFDQKKIKGHQKVIKTWN